MKTLTLKLPDALFAEIASDAKARNVSKSQVVRERLAHGRTDATRGSLWSRMEDLVIEADSLPADLSSNKTHLKRYGKNRSDR
ncbi:MAG: CopG family transcriptional regulator [Chthoniobacterales bacterium]